MILNDVNYLETENYVHDYNSGHRHWQVAVSTDKSLVRTNYDAYNGWLETDTVNITQRGTGIGDDVLGPFALDLNTAEKEAQWGVSGQSGFCELPIECEDFTWDFTLAVMDPNRYFPGAKDITKLIEDKDSLASGIAMDGVSVGVILYRVPPSADPVNTIPPSIILRIANADDPSDVRFGTLYNYDTNKNYVQGPPNSGTAEIQTRAEDVVAIGQGGSARRYILALYVAPNVNTANTELSSRNLKIEAKAGGQVLAETSLTLYAPPLVTLHGVWSDGAIWQRLKNYLEKQGYPAASLVLGDYRRYNASSFMDSKVQESFKRSITSALNSARLKKGIIATQVDVVAHSLGGLITRGLAKQDNYKNSENFNQGYINRLITVTTPHSGSPLANWLVRHENDEMDSGTHLLQTSDCSHDDNLSACMAKLGKPITQGAVAALAQGSADLGALNTIIPYRAVITVAPAFTDVEWMLNKIAAAYDQHTGSEPDDTIDALLGAQHDTIVPLYSQHSGTDQIVLTQGLVHADSGGINLPSSIAGPKGQAVTQSETVFEQIFCWLMEKYCIVADSMSAASKQSVSKTAVSAGTTTASPLSDADLSAYTEINPGLLDISPAAGTELIVDTATPIAVTATGKTISRILSFADFTFGEWAEAPFDIQLTAEKLGPFSLHLLVLFDDNTYAKMTLPYRVIGQGDLVYLDPDDGAQSFPKLIEIDTIDIDYPMRPRAYYAQSLPKEVRDLAQYRVKSGTDAVVTVAEGGYLTPKAEGRDVIEVSFGGLTVEIPVMVKQESVVGPGTTAEVVLSNLSQTYDGTPKAASCTTTPEGLATTLTYNGFATPPTDVGSYPVQCLVNDATYTGSASGTLSIAKAATSTSILDHSPNPSLVGQPLTVSVSVSVTSPGGGTPTGDVTISDGTVSCSFTLPATSCALTPTSSGDKTLTATYAGAPNFQGSAGSVSHRVNSGPTTTYSGGNPGGDGEIDAGFTGGGSTCQFVDPRFVAASTVATPPPGVGFPYGLFAFGATGCERGATLRFSIRYPQTLPPGTQFWKYGRTSTYPAPHWYPLTAAANNLAIAGNQVSFSIQDGGLGDNDLQVNGDITDPGGPATGLAGGGAGNGSDLKPIPTLSLWALLVLTIGTLLLSFGGLRRAAKSK